MYVDFFRIIVLCFLIHLIPHSIETKTKSFFLLTRRLEKLPQINAEMNKKFLKFVSQCLVSVTKFNFSLHRNNSLSFNFAALWKWGNGTCKIWQASATAADQFVLRKWQNRLLEWKISKAFIIYLLKNRAQRFIFSTCYWKRNKCWRSKATNNTTWIWDWRTKEIDEHIKII